MKVLFLVLEPPYPPNDGGRIRTFALLRRLARDCQVTLLTFSSTKQPEEDWTPLQQVCCDVEVVPVPATGRPTATERLRLFRQRLPLAIRLYDSAEMVGRVRKLVQSGKYDLLHVNELYLAPYARLTQHLPRVMDHTDVEAIKQHRMLLADPARYTPYWWLRWVEHGQWRTFERRSLTWFDAHMAVSERDAGYFRQHARGVPVTVVPNGVDTAVVQPRPDPQGDPTLLYLGSMDYPPNADAVLDFARRTLPLIRQAVRDVRLLVVGRNPPPEVQRLDTQPGITVTGTVPDVRPYYEQSHVSVVPLRSGGGTRLKILEALAVGVPVVSTFVGAEGLDLTPDKDLLIANDPKAFAAQVVRLLSDPMLRTALATQGRKTAVAQYDWSVIGDRLIQVYEMAVTKSCTVRRAPQGLRG